MTNKKRKILLCLLCENNRSNQGMGLKVNFRNHYDSKYPKKFVCMPCYDKLKYTEAKKTLEKLNLKQEKK